MFTAEMKSILVIKSTSIHYLTVVVAIVAAVPVVAVCCSR